MSTHARKCNMSIYIVLLSFIYSIKSRFLVNLGVAAVEVSMRGRAAVVKEASVEATTEEIGSSGVDGSGGDRRSRERHQGDR
jgi:hypothetical protein